MTKQVISLSDNAAARINGISYSKFIGSLKKEEIRINRKMLAQLAVADPGTFKKVVTEVQS